MRSRKANKFPCRYDLGFLPESRKMPLIDGNQVVRMCGIGALEKPIVIRVARDFKASRRGDNITVVPDELQQLLANPFANTQFLTREHIRVFLQDGVRHVEARRLGNGEHKGSALQTLW